MSDEIQGREIDWSAVKTVYDVVQILKALEIRVTGDVAERLRMYLGPLEEG